MLRIVKIVTKFVRNIIILFFALTILWVVALRFVPVLTTPLMFIRLVEQNKEDREMRLSHSWTSLSDMPAYAATAVIAAEDQNFTKHHGFDFKAIQKAAMHNREGGKIRGGSTISQQTAKNVFLWPGRSWLRKGLEAYFTCLIELMWPKERIIEVYLNSIEMGEGIYGIKAAAEAYWQTEPQDLTRLQCATIAAILPNPRKYSATNPSSYIRRRSNSIFQSMKYLETHGYTLDAKE